MATSLTLATFASRALPSLGNTVSDSQKPVQTQQHPTRSLPPAQGNTQTIPLPPAPAQQQQQPPAAPAKKLKF